MKRRGKPIFKSFNVIAAIAVCAAVCLAGLGYVWAKREIYALGGQIKEKETQLEELKRSNAVLSQSYATLCSPRVLDESVRRLNLGLSSPRADQIIRLPEPSTEGRTQYAASREGHR